MNGGFFAIRSLYSLKFALFSKFKQIAKGNIFIYQYIHKKNKKKCSVTLRRHNFKKDIIKGKRNKEKNLIDRLMNIQGEKNESLNKAEIINEKKIKFTLFHSRTNNYLPERSRKQLAIELKRRILHSFTKNSASLYIVRSQCGPKQSPINVWIHFSNILGIFRKYHYNGFPTGRFTRNLKHQN